MVSVGTGSKGSSSSNSLPWAGILLHKSWFWALMLHEIAKLVLHFNLKLLWILKIDLKKILFYPVSVNLKWLLQCPCQISSTCSSDEMLMIPKFSVFSWHSLWWKDAEGSLLSSIGPQQTSGLCLTALGFLLPRDQHSSPSPQGDLVCSELVAAPPANEVGIINSHAGEQAGAGTGPSKVHRRWGGRENKISFVQCKCALLFP